MHALAVIGYMLLAFAASFGVGVVAEEKASSVDAGAYSFFASLAVAFALGTALF